MQCKENGVDTSVSSSNQVANDWAKVTFQVLLNDLMQQSTCCRKRQHLWLVEVKHTKLVHRTAAMEVFTFEIRW